ncbi:MAG: hypothetical protein FGM24_01100 [Candidatus Kapabacteria bacterium]|nr:hypothetical protein [Candidatus Kapabacteria bacterium]
MRKTLHDVSLMLLLLGIVTVGTTVTTSAQTSDSANARRDTTIVTIGSDTSKTAAWLLDLFSETGVSTSQPYVMLWGGQSMISRTGLEADVEPVISAGVSFGTETAKSIPGGVRRCSRDGLYLWTGLTPDSSATQKATLGVWRFGFEEIVAWGYASEESASGVYFIHGTNNGWSILDVTRAPAQPEEQYLTDFGSAMRYGETMRAGIDVRFGAVSINAAYTWDQIYTRHLFWKQAGSSLLEGVADVLVVAFVKAVGKSSPKAVPIMHFLMRNGLAYGFKSLRAKNMTWPFGADTSPLNIQTYSVGLTVSF